MSGKIMIIDDNDTVLLSAEVILKQAGFEVVTSKDAYCTDVIVQEQPDLILLDVLMPSMNGDQAAKVFSDIPNLLDGGAIILHSNLPEEELRDRAIEAGVAGYLKKAEDPDEFVDEIRKWLAVLKTF